MAKLDMIGLVTRDMAASFRFYGLLGLETASLDPNEPYQEAVLPNGLRVSWNRVEMVKEHDPGWVEPQGSRLGLAFLCDSPADVDATYARLIDAGFTGRKAPWDAVWGQRYALVEDPDGSVVDLFAAL